MMSTIFLQMFSAGGAEISGAPQIGAAFGAAVEDHIKNQQRKHQTNRNPAGNHRPFNTDLAVGQDHAQANQNGTDNADSIYIF